VSWAVSPCSEPPEDIGDSVFHAEAPVAGSMRNPRTRRHGTGEDQPPRIRVNATDGAPTGWCLVSPSSMCARSPQHRLVRHQSGVDRAWFRDARPARTGGAEAAMGFQRVTGERNVLLASTRPGAMHRWPAGSVIPAESAAAVRRIRTAGTALSGTGGSRTRCPAEVQLRCRPRDLPPRPRARIRHDEPRSPAGCTSASGIGNRTGCSGRLCCSRDRRPVSWRRTR
jgi:hypothetical protein